MTNDITITLSKGKVGLLSNDDSDLAALKWYAAKKATGDGHYVRRRPWKVREAVHLHRLVLARILGRPLVKGEVPDHINGDGLDNRRENLRLASKSQNGANKSKHRDNSSGYKGVSFCSSRGKWAADVQVNGHRRRLGRFDNIIDAAVAYDRAAYELHSEFANVNYPRFACGLGSNND